MDNPSFGAFLTRLSDQGRLDVDAVPRHAELGKALRGEAPSPALLRQLAPMTGFHAADLFVIAGLTVPKDLTPVDPTAGSLVVNLVSHTRSLTPEDTDTLFELAGSLPQWPHLKPNPLAAVADRYATGPGAVLMRMARNRNLDWSATARTFRALTGRNWSTATYGSIAYGQAALPPDLILDFATVLGIAAEDLAALAGVPLTEPFPAPEPHLLRLAELVWDVRRLTAAQLRLVVHRSISIWLRNRNPPRRRFSRWLPKLSR
jgi:hypothetical protein